MDARRRFGFREALAAAVLAAALSALFVPRHLLARLLPGVFGPRAQALAHTRRAMEALKALSDPERVAAGEPALRRLPGDSCVGCPGEPDCAAMDVCTHDLTSALPASFTAPPVNGRLSYTVTEEPCPGGTCKKVQFQSRWGP